MIHGDIILTQKLGYDLGPLGKKKKEKQFHEKRRHETLSFPIYRIFIRK